MKWVNAAIVAAVAVVVVVAASITLLPRVEPVNLEELKSSLVNSLSGVETMRQETHMTVSTGGAQYVVEMSLVELIDYRGQEASFNVTMTVKNTPMATPVNTTIYLYYVNKTVYFAQEIPGAPLTWYKQVAPEELWSQLFTNPANITSMFLNASDLEYLGMDVVNSVECFVVDVKPRMSELVNMTSLILGPQLTGTLRQLGVEDLSELIKDLDIKMWISKSDYLPLKQVVSMTMSIMNMDFQVSGETTHSYNLPVSISLPEEAYNATPVQQEYPCG